MDIKQLNKELEKFLENNSDNESWEYKLQKNSFFETALNCIYNFQRIGATLEINIGRLEEEPSKFGYYINEVPLPELVGHYSREIASCSTQEKGIKTPEKVILKCRKELQKHYFYDEGVMSFNPPINLLNLL